MEKEQFTYVATCLFGLEKFVGEEIDSLGYTRLETIDGRIIFRGPMEAMARCNLWLRTAERLFLLLGRFPADSFDALFEGTRALPWERWIGCDDSFPVSGHAIHSKLFSIPDCQSIVKKAIATRLGQEYGITQLPETEQGCKIEFFLLNDEAFLMLDLSGTALHKRGYRPTSGEAPLRETLAAAMVKISRPRENVLLWDPFCGSGTIAIEAALMMSNTAPGWNRNFAAQSLLEIPKSIWKQAREETQDVRRPDTAFRAYASDLDPAMVELASGNVRRACVGRYVKTFCQDARKLQSDGQRITIVCNPPYGERMGTPEAVHRLWTEVGSSWKKFEKWQIYVICSDEEFERYFGRRADKVRRLYNGMIRCGYYQFFRTPGSPASLARKQSGSGKAKTF